jgi:hypothetical protein
MEIKNIVAQVESPATVIRIVIRMASESFED